MINDTDILENYKIIYKNDNWTIDILSKYHFDFEKNAIIANNKETVLLILNESLPYFYYRLNDTKYCRAAHFHIIIEDEYIENTRKNSKKYQYKKYDNHDFKLSAFTKNILDYAGFLGSSSRSWGLFYASYSEYLREKREEQKREQRQIQRLKQQQQVFIAQQIENDNGGIYGLYSVNKETKEETLLYIGLTTRTFQERFEEHKNIILGTNQIPRGMEKLYRLLIKEHKTNWILGKPIIIFNEIKTNKVISQSEKEAMELSLITYFKPPGNTSGVDVPYYFSNSPKVSIG